MTIKEIAKAAIVKLDRKIEGVSVERLDTPEGARGVHGRLSSEHRYLDELGSSLRFQVKHAMTCVGILAYPGRRAFPLRDAEYHLSRM